MSFVKRFPKIFFFLLVAILFLGLGLFYNQERKTFAQQEILLECGEEIPIGEAIDEAIDLAVAIDAQLQIIYTAPGVQIEAAKILFDLPEECRAENCNTGCDITSSEVEANTCPDPCPSQTESRCGDIGEPCPPGEDCTDFCVSLGECAYCWDEEICEPCTITETTCEVRSCSGVPCPFGEITNQFNQIEGSYFQIKAAKEEIARLIAVDRNAILDKLERARGELEGCVVSADAMIEGEIIGEALWTCDEVKYQGLLPEGETCYPNNFFCCQLR